MKAIKVKDTAGNINYVKGDVLKTRSLVKASIGNRPYKGRISTMFFCNYSDLKIYLEKHPKQILIGKGCLCLNLKNGNSKNKCVYEITEIN